MAKTINMNESLNNKFIDAIPYEESVLSYNAVLTHNANLLKLAIERIITHKGEGSVQPVDGKAFLYTSKDGKVCIYELQSFGDTIAIHDKDNGSIIMLCDYACGLVEECEALDIPTTLVARPKIEEEEIIETMEDDEPIAAPIVAPAPVANPLDIVLGAIKGAPKAAEQPTTEQPAPVTSASPEVVEQPTYDLTIALHANKQGECKTYYVHGKGYKSIPKAVLDKWYPAGKGKATKAHSAFWSKARFEANGGIDALRKELPDMNIEFVDTMPAPVPSASPEVIEQPTTEATIAPIEQPTEEGSAPATFPEEKKPTKKSAEAVQPTKPVRRTRKPKAEAKPKAFAIVFNNEDKAKVQGILAKAKAKCGDTSKSKVEFFMVAGSNNIVLSFYNAKGKKAIGGVYLGITSLQMGEGNANNGNELVLAYAMDSTEVSDMMSREWNGMLTA